MTNCALDSRTPALLEIPSGFFVHLPGITPAYIRPLALAGILISRIRSGIPWRVIGV